MIFGDYHHHLVMAKATVFRMISWTTTGDHHCIFVINVDDDDGETGRYNFERTMVVPDDDRFD